MPICARRPPATSPGRDFVLDASHEHVLLLHHARLDRWLQPGGHGEGETDPRAIALREIEEETGLSGWRKLTIARQVRPQ